MIIRISAGDITEITIEEAAEVADAMDLVRAMIANGVTAAKISNSDGNQTKTGHGRTGNQHRPTCVRETDDKTRIETR